MRYFNEVHSLAEDSRLGIEGDDEEQEYQHDLYSPSVSQPCHLQQPTQLMLGFNVIRSGSPLISQLGDGGLGSPGA